MKEPTLTIKAGDAFAILTARYHYERLVTLRGREDPEAVALARRIAEMSAWRTANRAAVRAKIERREDRF